MLPPPLETFAWQVLQTAYFVSSVTTKNSQMTERFFAILFYNNGNNTHAQASRDYRIGLLLKDRSDPIPISRKSCRYMVKPITDPIIGATLKVMGVCLCHIEAIICDEFFFKIFAFVCSEKRQVKENLPVIDSLFMANTMVKISALYINLLVLVSYNRFCKCL